MERMKPRRTTGKSDNSDRRNRSINSVNDGLFDTASSTNIQRDKSLFYDRWKVKETLQKIAIDLLWRSHVTNSIILYVDVSRTFELVFQSTNPRIRFTISS